MNPFHIELRPLPAEGRHVAGTLPPAFFDLAPGDSVQAASPLAYDLRILREGDSLHVSGSLEAGFSLQCGRCLERFPHRVRLENFEEEAPLENESTTDLTELVREDILLALPSYPRCEDGNVEQRECPAEGKFERDDTPDADGLPGAERGIWNALDQLK